MTQALFLDGRLEVRLNEIPDNSVDLIYADLPYATGTKNQYNQAINMPVFWQHVDRIIKPNAAVVLHADDPFAFELRKTASVTYRYKYIWGKNKATGGMNASIQPMRNVEEILVFYYKQCYYEPQMTTGHKPQNNCYRGEREEDTYGKQTAHKNARAGKTDRFPTQLLLFDVVNNDDPDRIHAAQKPLSISSHVVKTYAAPGMTMLDASAGSCSSVIAALQHGVNAIAVEPDKVMMSKAIERVHRHCPDAELVRQ